MQLLGCQSLFHVRTAPGEEEWPCLPKRVGLSSDMIPEVLDCSKGQSLPDGFLRFFFGSFTVKGLTANREEKYACNLRRYWAYGRWGTDRTTKSKTYFDFPLSYVDRRYILWFSQLCTKRSISLIYELLSDDCMRSNVFLCEVVRFVSSLTRLFCLHPLTIHSRLTWEDEKVLSIDPVSANHSCSLAVQGPPPSPPA